MPRLEGAGVGELCRVVICRPNALELGVVGLPMDEETGGWELMDELLGGLLVIALLVLLPGDRLVMALPELTLLGARLVIARLGLLLGEMLLELLGDGALGVALGEGAGLETCRLC